MYIYTHMYIYIYIISKSKGKVSYLSPLQNSLSQSSCCLCLRSCCMQGQNVYNYYIYIHNVISMITYFYLGVSMRNAYLSAVQLLKEMGSGRAEVVWKTCVLREKLRLAHSICKPLWEATVEPEDTEVCARLRVKPLEHVWKMRLKVF